MSQQAMTQRTGSLYLATAPSGRRYVGITTQGAEKRWRDHCKEVRRGVKSHLNSAIKKYGDDGFELRTLAIASWEELNRLEPLAIVAYGTRSPKGYNLRAGGSQSSPHPESVARQAAKLRGRKWTEERKAEHCRVMSSPEVVEKLSDAHKGNTHSDQTKAKMRIARAGRAPSTECKEMARQARIGSKHTEQAKKKMSESSKRAWAKRKEKM